VLSTSSQSKLMLLANQNRGRWSVKFNFALSEMQIKITNFIEYNVLLSAINGPPGRDQNKEKEKIKNPFWIQRQKSESNIKVESKWPFESFQAIEGNAYLGK
jgi:hypothetical protein